MAHFGTRGEKWTETMYKLVEKSRSQIVYEIHTQGSSKSAQECFFSLSLLLTHGRMDWVNFGCFRVAFEDGG